MQRILVLAALASLAPLAAAQAPQAVAGTYEAASVPAFGDFPRGQMILTSDGRYSIVVMRSTLAKFAAGARTKGTADENRMVVEGSLAHAGRYSIEEGGRYIVFHIEMSTYPNWDGRAEKRPLRVADGERVTYTVPNPSAGGAPVNVSWRRIGVAP